ncbi:hypothetical protein BDR26DRAFT_900731 [Obelidium mucronatum]|nr:hypothetical protein BDR26DRAFT_900731 [Obelidium mucronatum]
MNTSDAPHITWTPTATPPATATELAFGFGMNGSEVVGIVFIGVAGLVVSVGMILGFIWCYSKRFKRASGALVADEDTKNNEVRHDDVEQQEQQRRDLQVPVTEPVSSANTKTRRMFDVFSTAAARSSSSVTPPLVNRQESKVFTRTATAASSSSSSSGMSPLQDFGMRNTSAIAAGIQALGLPMQPLEWSIENVSEWVKVVCRDGERMADLMQEHRIDGNALLLLTAVDIQETLGMNALGDRLKFQNAIRELMAFSQFQQIESSGGGSASHVFRVDSRRQHPDGNDLPAYA